MLRTLDDAKALRADLEAVLSRSERARLVIVGGGFVGLEVAASLGGREAVDTTVVLRNALPLATLFGEAFGTRLKREHEAAGVSIRPEAEVTGFEAAGGSHGARVLLANGDAIDADVVLLAVGAVPRTGWLPFGRNEDGGVSVDARLAVPGAGGEYAAGDIARLLTPWGEVRIEHWRFAQECGELAARNLLGAGEVYDSTPFFWSMQQIKGSYTFTGHSSRDATIEGQVDETDFALHFVDKGRLVATLAHGLDDGLTRLERRMAGRG